MRDDLIARLQSAQIRCRALVRCRGTVEGVAKGRRLNAFSHAHPGRPRVRRHV